MPDACSQARVRLYVYLKCRIIPYYPLFITTREGFGAMQTPCYVIDLDRLKSNLQKIETLKTETSCSVFFALKGFSMECVLPIVLQNLDGVSASGDFEARLGKDFNQMVSTFSPAFPPNSFDSIAQNSDIVVFNSMDQYHRYSAIVYRHKHSCGIRINPEYSELPDEFGANPCKPFSHMGIKKGNMPSLDYFGPGKIEGIHLHTMCGQDADTLERMIDNLVQKYDTILGKVSWINLGGGQLYGDDDYDLERAIKCIRQLKARYNASIMVEPCEGVLINCGFLVTTVLDVVHNEKDIAILDSSAVCHLSDAVYRDWKRDVLGGAEPGEYPYEFRLAGNSCYTGDIFGEYSFPDLLQRGDKIVFVDTATYSAVKACMFNGLPFPSVAVYDKKNGLQIKKKFDYDLFRQSL